MLKYSEGFAGLVKIIKLLTGVSLIKISLLHNLCLRDEILDSEIEERRLSTITKGGLAVVGGASQQWIRVNQGWAGQDNSGSWLSRLSVYKININFHAFSGPKVVDSHVPSYTPSRGAIPKTRSCWSCRNRAGHRSGPWVGSRLSLPVKFTWTTGNWILLHWWFVHDLTSLLFK